MLSSDELERMGLPMEELDCGCRLKPPPRVGYALLSPENSPEPQRYYQLSNGGSNSLRHRTVMNRTTTCPEHDTSEEARTPPPAPTQSQQLSFLSVALLESVNELRELGADQMRSAARKRESARIRAEWRRAADVAEYLSLFAFLLASLLCTLLFAYHGWY